MGGRERRGEEEGRGGERRGEEGRGEEERAQQGAKGLNEVKLKPAVLF